MLSTISQLLYTVKFQAKDKPMTLTGNIVSIRRLPNKGKLTSNRTIERDPCDFRGFREFFFHSLAELFKTLQFNYLHRGMYSVFITYHGAKKSTIATWETVR